MSMALLKSLNSSLSWSISGINHGQIYVTHTCVVSQKQSGTKKDTNQA
ncbi:BnaC02g34470D [Brassica napus]|uniref:BnaC02g34470D protein n=1 Tax=Brassica napus TaxID=3708 RepID=A0A078FTZ0_BRANA|nr:BnaC02g34470D [Brassica napus]